MVVQYQEIFSEVDWGAKSVTQQGSPVSPRNEPVLVFLPHSIIIGWEQELLDLSHKHSDSY